MRGLDARRSRVGGVGGDVGQLRNLRSGSGNGRKKRTHVIPTVVGLLLRAFNVGVVHVRVHDRVFGRYGGKQRGATVLASLRESYDSEMLVVASLAATTTTTTVCY